jgi:hypothetical protein
MMHQAEVLAAAFRSKGTVGAFSSELDRLYGSAFAGLTDVPRSHQRTRRPWDPAAQSGKRASQDEQRIVDVTVRDALQIVHGLPVATKSGWEAFADDLTLRASWYGVASAIRRRNGRPDRQSGYFWASMLAATAATLPLSSAQPTTPSAAVIRQAATDVRFQAVRHPRANSGRTVQVIREMGDAVSVRQAADALVSALVTHAGTPSHDIVFFLVGAVISADLWRHPVAVRYLLIPAVSRLRLLSGRSFSLDSTAQPVEDLIWRHLGHQWDQRGAW